MTSARSELILAAGNEKQVQLLETIRVRPQYVTAPDDYPDVRQLRFETPRAMVLRVAGYNVRQVSHKLRQAVIMGENCFVLSCYSCVCIGRQVLIGRRQRDDAHECFKALSGRAHKIFTGVVLKSPSGRIISKVVVSKVYFKRLSDLEIELYLESSQWIHQNGYYDIDGMAGLFVTSIMGSASGVRGLPLYEVACMLAGEGFDIYGEWKKNMVWQ